MEDLGRSRKLLFSLLMVALTAVIILVAAEVMVRLSVPEETFWPVSNIYQPSDIPGLVYTYQPNFEGTAFGVDLTTNQLGFRGDNWSKEKKAGTFRVALIGDSHAFGFGVPSENTVWRVLGDLLEERYGSPAEVLSFGVNGYTSFQQLATLKEMALDFAPDMVIILPANNDHQEPLRADADGWLHWDGKGENEKSRMVDKSIEEVEVREVSWWMEKSRLFLYLKLLEKRQGFAGKAQVQRAVDEVHSPDTGADWLGPFPPGPVSKRLEEKVYVPVVEMLDILDAEGLPVIVASFCGSRDYRQMFQILTEERGLIVLELLALFPEASSWQDLTKRFGLGWDDHLNSAAHRRWAVALDELIAEHGLHPKAGT